MDTRLAVLTLPYNYESIANPRELIVDYENGEIYVKSEDGLENIKVGSGRYGELRIANQHGTFAEDTDVIDITIEGYDPEKDKTIWLYIGGVFKTVNVEYSIDGYQIKKLDTQTELFWRMGWDYNIILVKNVKDLDIDLDFIDASMFVPGSIGDISLSDASGQVKDRLASHIEDDQIHGGIVDGTVVTYESRYVVSGSETIAPHGLVHFDRTKDLLMVFEDSKKIVKGYDYYVLNNAEIQKRDDQWADGTVLDFVMIKNVTESANEGITPTRVILEDEDEPGTMYELVAKSGQPVLRVVEKNE